eukprot:6187221-Pleurochrysis_carterae.AAC.1
MTAEGLASSYEWTDGYRVGARGSETGSEHMRAKFGNRKAEGTRKLVPTFAHTFSAVGGDAHVFDEQRIGADVDTAGIEATRMHLLEDRSRELPQPAARARLEQRVLRRLRRHHAHRVQPLQLRQRLRHVNLGRARAHDAHRIDAHEASEELAHRLLGPRDRGHPRRRRRRNLLRRARRAVVKRHVPAKSAPPDIAGRLERRRRGRGGARRLGLGSHRAVVHAWRRVWRRAERAEGARRRRRRPA